MANNDKNKGSNNNNIENDIKINDENDDEDDEDDNMGKILKALSNESRRNL